MEKMPQARRGGLIIQEVDSEILIYDQNTNKAHCLNQTAAKVWKYCDGETTLADACSALSRDLDTPVDEKLVWYAVDQFAKDNLLEKDIEPPAFVIAGMNRTTDGAHTGISRSGSRAAGNFDSGSYARPGCNLPPAGSTMWHQRSVLFRTVQR